MAMATAKRASELVALLSDDNHFRWEGENIHFVSSRLTKTNRPGHLSPPLAMESRFVHLSGGDRKTHFD
jgi:hypothetical protein